MHERRRPSPARLASALVALVALTAASPAAAQRFTIEQVIAPPFPFDLVAARTADRIGWIEYEEGRRNVWTAAAPELRPVKLTNVRADDGNDLSGLQISDDGSVLLFVRGHIPNRDGWIANPASDADGTERAAWAVRTGGGEPWRIAEAWDPRLSPDGRWIVYTKGDRIHRAPVDPTALRSFDPDTAGPLFTGFGTQEAPVWAPDSRRFAFVTDRGDHSYIGVYDMDAHAVTYMAPGVDRDVAPAWSPDGRRIAFIRRPGLPFGADRTPQPWWRRPIEPDTILPDGLTDAGFAGGHKLEIWVADARTGEGRRLWHNWPAQDRFNDVRALDWVGDRIVFQAEPGAWEGHRWAITVSDPEREPVELTPGEGFVEHVAYSPDGRWLYYAANIGDVDRRDLWRVPVAGGRPEKLTGGETMETYPAVLPSGDVAVLLAGPALPQTVAVVDPDGGRISPVTRPPASFPADAHVVPENVLITAEDGVVQHAQLWMPPDLEPGEKRPALMFIHGGSRRQMLLGYHYMHFYHMAYAMNQYFASKGYVTLSINYRSGIGYGTAFRDVPDYGRRGNSEYRDVIAAGKYLQGRPDVDPERVGLWGLSYGGILTAQGLARNSDVFKAGVDIAGVHLYGDDVEDKESTLYRSSAIAAIDTWESPVLLIHGDDDRNVDFSQTVGLVQLLRAHDVPYELIVYPDDVHDFLLHSRWIDAFGATDDFFGRTLGGKGIAAGDN